MPAAMEGAAVQLCCGPHGTSCCPQLWQLPPPCQPKGCGPCRHISSALEVLLPQPPCLGQPALLTQPERVCWHGLAEGRVKRDWEALTFC